MSFGTPEKEFRIRSWKLLPDCTTSEFRNVSGDCEGNEILIPDNVYWSVPQVLQDAVRAPAVMILNPTHTRMGNCGTVRAWREYLSSGGRVYVSASNWDVAN